MTTLITKLEAAADRLDFIDREAADACRDAAARFRANILYDQRKAAKRREAAARRKEATSA